MCSVGREMQEWWIHFAAIATVKEEFSFLYSAEHDRVDKDVVGRNACESEPQAVSKVAISKTFAINTITCIADDTTLVLMNLDGSPVF